MKSNELIDRDTMQMAQEKRTVGRENARARVWHRFLHFIIAVTVRVTLPEEPYVSPLNRRR